MPLKGCCPIRVSDAHASIEGSPPVRTAAFAINERINQLYIEHRLRNLDFVVREVAMTWISGS